NEKLERQLKDLLAVAKLNDALVEKIHQLGLRLMTAHSVPEKLELLETSLREDFLAERAVLVLFSEYAGAAVSNGFVKILDRNDPALKPFGSFLRSARPRCGMLLERQR